MDLRSATQLLSQAELDVFCHMLTNMTIRQIAAELGLSEQGVRFHMSNIYKKTNTKGRPDLLSRFIHTSMVNSNIMLFMRDIRKELDTLKAQVERLQETGSNVQSFNRELEDVKRRLNNTLPSGR
jgi:DNA-binding CsgD family transcriptional regulator